MTMQDRMLVDRIPLIDIAPFRHGTAADRKRVAQEVGTACEEIGFLVVTGHAVPEEIQDRLYRAGLDFFDLPLDEKLAVRRPKDDQNRAYIPYGHETLARMHGGDTPPDFKEVFAIGPIDVPDTPYYTTGNAYPSFAPNLWPVRPASLRPAMTAYWNALTDLSRTLASIMALSLGLPESFFDDRLDKQTSQLRLLHYPEPSQPLAPGQLRAGVHTDLGFMTILRNEKRSGGLQVRRRDGTWVDAPALPGTFVVNIGDLMMRWTNDRWISTPHRVAVPPDDARSGSRRLSIGFFVGPNYDAMVECLPTCIGPGNPPKYPPISSHDYRTGRFAAGAGLRTTVAAAAIGAAAE